LNYPPPSLDFIKVLTDNTGIIQHAKFMTPRLKDGYTTDDNSRALIALTKCFQILNNSEDLIRLVDIYLRFLLLMQKSNGRMHNVLDYARQFADEEGSEDSMGRTLWSCGCVTESNLSKERCLLAKEIFDRLLPSLMTFNSPRALAFSVLGLAKYQKAFRKDSNPTKNMRVLVDKLLENYKVHNSRGWEWFEPYLTYCNGRLPQALLEAYELIADKEIVEVAVESLNFLIKIQVIDGVFVPIGNFGWYERGGRRAIYDQQSVEAASMAEAALSAYRITGKSYYGEVAKTVFNWFFGKNSLGVKVYDSKTGACYDGITAEGLNLNMGAEATACFLSARLDFEMAKISLSST
jgi:uncharacterized protein YyaL (SSP411 family)